jgi:hypothetical protein
VNKPENSWLKGQTGNPSGRPINARTRIVGLCAAHPSHGPEAHGESVLGHLALTRTCSQIAIRERQALLDTRRFAS